VFGSSSLPVLLLGFAGAAAAVWVAGTRLSNTTDVLSERLGLGEALGGLILLALVTNLPEIAITASAALSDELGVAVGNILGGIAIQTFVLVVVDALGVGGGHPLTYRAASLVLVLEGALVVAVLTVAVMGSQLPPSLVVWRVEPEALLIAALWVAGVWLLSKARSDLPWQEEGDAPTASRSRAGTPRPRRTKRPRTEG
jgi:cation:H+ antiporter